MRKLTPTLVLCALLAGCSAPGIVVSTPSESLAVSDYRLPRDRRGKSHPHVGLQAGFGLGEVGIETSGAGVLPAIDDDAQAVVFRGTYESGGKLIGGGFQFEGAFSDNDLMAFTRSEVDALDFFAHVTIRPVAGPLFRIPIRVGPTLTNLAIDSDANSSEVDFLSLGARVEVEPEIDVFQHDRGALSVFGSLSLGVGRTAVDVETATVNDVFGTSFAQVRARFGARFRLRRFTSSLSWIVRGTSFDESDRENGVRVQDTDFTAHALLLQAGWRH